MIDYNLRSSVVVSHFSKTITLLIYKLLLFLKYSGL